ncbi:MAG: cobaltochelatase subunit CobN, partial [Synechococcaceae cyanobacterium ELA182]
AALREGGATNLEALLVCCAALLRGEIPEPPPLRLAADPLPHDWQADPGPRVGLIVYRALLQAGDLVLVEACLQELRTQGLAPRALWVSSLRDPAVQQGVGDLLEREAVEAVLCATGFASVQFEDAGLGAPLWERLQVPVLQLLCSGRSQRSWRESSIGLGPLDLSLQIALPELDGRISTRVGAFKELAGASDRLGTGLQRLQPDPERLQWIVTLTRHWINLRQTASGERRVALVLANYPTRNSRLANGVGLDTPASVALMLGWLAQAGYDLGQAFLPAGGDALIQALLAGRSNDPESSHRPPLAHLSLADYERWYASLPESGRQRLEAVWGPPAADRELEILPDGAAFPVRGLRFGRVVLLIQPDRGYDRDPALSYHSPDLPPTHSYLAQYLWLRQSFAAQVVVHVGKHGNLEWLPGKGLGLSPACFPEWALGPLPHLYPFIVNDPGEGSQAKRRAQAVILDHLTPPLGRAGLHGPLQALEARLDEYWEASQLGAERAALLREQLAVQLRQLELPGLANDLDLQLEQADGYLCELKEAQIRLGLHTYGTLPAPPLLAELLLCLARAPQAGLPGLTQALARDLDLELDPWADGEDEPLSPADRQRLSGLEQGSTARRIGDGVALLERWALELVQQQLEGASGDSGAANPAPGSAQAPAPAAIEPTAPLAGVPGAATESVLQHLRQHLQPALLACGEAERQALLRGLAGGRIAAGPSGAPTRGRPDLLPTGRNFYSVDLRGLPTEAAWDLGRRSAELLLELHRQEEGEDLRVLVLSVWGTATMRNGGEDIAQALALMGVRPVWDGPTRRLVDLEVIPLSLLGRPRVDVTLRISGLF